MSWKFLASPIRNINQSMGILSEGRFTGKHATLIDSLTPCSRMVPITISTLGGRHDTGKHYLEEKSREYAMRAMTTVSQALAHIFH